MRTNGPINESVSRRRWSSTFRRRWKIISALGRLRRAACEAREIFGASSFVRIASNLRKGEKQRDQKQKRVGGDIDRRRESRNFFFFFSFLESGDQRSRVAVFSYIAMHYKQYFLEEVNKMIGKIVDRRTQRPPTRILKSNIIQIILH